MTKAADLIEEFRTTGLVRLESALDDGLIRQARDQLLNLAREHGVLAEERWAMSHSRFGLPKPFRNALNTLNRSADFPDLIHEDLIQMAEELVEDSVTPMAPGQQILFSLPSKEPWSIPRDIWHIDLPRQGMHASPGLQVFTFLDDVEPEGGGTLVVTGSHRLINNLADLPSKKFKQLLKQERYFRSLLNPDLPSLTWSGETTGRVGEVDVEVVELTGKAGDVYLMDLRMLHTPAPNSSHRARMMLTCRLPITALAARYSNAEAMT